AKVYYDETTGKYSNKSSEVDTVLDDMSAEDYEGAVYYNVQGISSTVPFRGLNIVRFTNGTVKKILVK
ncbi:MAG: hypothetical protein K2J74_01030, partial [Muribaculaceae bacterium]|nr:hypothetical protein [Muribaculaceae bacterium]